MMNGVKEEPPIHGGAPASSRWTPTKEQINILESLYKQGIRTPTADQIQQITNRLKDYGTIEGKNVFYWFQNHKARQRQKQKQEVAAAAYFTNFYHHPSPPPPPPPPLLFSPPNNGCRVVRVQPAGSTTLEFGFHGGMNNMMMTPKVLLPGPVKRKSVDFQPYMDMNMNKGGHGQYHNRFGMVGPSTYNHNSVGYMNGSTNNVGSTLRLFPLEPTGGKAAAAEVGEESWSGITAVDDDEEETKGRRFFDFL